MLKFIAIESGHGKGSSGIFNDNGASGILNNVKKIIYERDINVEIGKRLVKILRSKPELKNVQILEVGINTKASVSKKMQYINNDIIKKLNTNPKDIIGISLHCDSANTKKYCMGYYQANNTGFKILGNTILQAINKYFGTPNRGLKSSATSRFGRLYIEDTPANWTIIEMDNMGAGLENLLQYDRMAEAIAYGIMNYVRTLR